MNTINCKLYFYKGIMPQQEHYVSVASVIRDCFRGKINAQDKLIEDYAVQMQDLQEITVSNQQMFCGIMRKHEKGYKPKIGEIGHLGESALNLPSNKWLTQRSHFIINPVNDVLLYHRGRNAVSVTNFAKYLQSLCSEKVNFEDVLIPDAYTRLINKGNLEMKKVSIKVAMPSNPDIVKDSNNKVVWDRELISFLEQLGGDAMKIEVTTMGARKSKRKFLDYETAKDFIEWVRDRRDNQEDSKAGGTVQFEEGKPIDIIADKLSVEVEIPEDNKEPKYPDILNAMQKAMADNMKKINKIFQS